MFRFNFVRPCGTAMHPECCLVFHSGAFLFYLPLAKTPINDNCLFDFPSRSSVSSCESYECQENMEMTYYRQPTEMCYTIDMYHKTKDNKEHPLNKCRTPWNYGLSESTLFIRIWLSIETMIDPFAYYSFHKWLGSFKSVFLTQKHFWYLFRFNNCGWVGYKPNVESAQGWNPSADHPQTFDCASGQAVVNYDRTW